MDKNGQGRKNTIFGNISTLLAMILSVIIPVYNVEKYLNQCVDSVLAQDFQDMEIILVDDGATDRSGQICETYAENDPRIKVIHQQNGGLSAARNTGIQNAKGDYIWFVDSDDWIAENALSVLKPYLAESKLEVIGFSHVDFFEDANQFVATAENKTIEETDGNGFIRQSDPFFPSAWTFVYKRSFLQEHGFLFKPGQLHEDDYFNLSSFGKIRKIIKIPHALYFYRRREGSIVTSADPANLKKRIVSYAALIELCDTISDIDKAYLAQKAAAYKRVSLALLESYILSGATRKAQYELVGDVKKTIPKIPLGKAEFSHSKVNFLKKLAYNIHPFIFISFVASFVRKK